MGTLALPILPRAPPIFLIPPFSLFFSFSRRFSTEGASEERVCGIYQNNIIGDSKLKSDGYSVRGEVNIHQYSLTRRGIIVKYFRQEVTLATQMVKINTST